MIDDPPDVSERNEQQIEEAFVKSGLHEFNGFGLEPWSPARIFAAQAMGMHYGSVDEAGRARFKADKVYPGAQRDTAIVLWLCTLKSEAEVDAVSRAPQSQTVLNKLHAFAAEHKLTDTGDENFWKGFIVFLDIMNEVAVSRVTAEKKITPDNTTIPPTKI